MPFDQNPLPMAVNPMVGSPTSMLMRWPLPVAGRPHIVVRFVAVVAINPHVASVRRIATDLDHPFRRPNENPDLRKRNRGRQN
jgi:hypothetical protein